jgi:signal peptidase I
MRHWLQRNRGFLVFLLALGLFRTAVADWNPIPSASMRPTLLEGDVVLVNRLAYDLKVPLTDVSLARLGEPRRGDVVTFTSPQDGVRLIKRIVGVPGDVIELRDDRLSVNGLAAAYSDRDGGVRNVEGAPQRAAITLSERLGDRTHEVQLLPAVPAMRSFGPVVVPPDHYFMLGDNRDDSADSRYIGFVPRELLIGQAHHILVSADITGSWMPRLGRVVQQIQ